MLIESRNLEDILLKETVFFYGIGNQFQDCLKLFEDKVEFMLFDKNKKGMYQGKYQIHLPEELSQYYKKGTAVVITSIKNQYEIAKDLVHKYHVSSDDLFSYTSKIYEDRIYQEDLIKKNKSKIERAYRLLEDEESRNYWKNAILMRLTRQPLYLEPNPYSIVTGEYKDVLELNKQDVIIDCGAYVGDTAEMYMKRLDGDCCIYALEPFGENYSLLQEKIEKSRWSNVRAYHCAVGGVNGKTMFHFEEEDFRMGITMENETGALTEEVEIHTLDELFGGLEKIDYIKMDIEGQETEALKGAAGILKNKAPKLMISGYHNLSDLWEIPCLIKEQNPMYKIYAGHAPGVSMEAEFYCKI